MNSSKLPAVARREEPVATGAAGDVSRSGGGAAVSPPHPARARRREALPRLATTYGVPAALLVVIGVFSALRPDAFATLDNAHAILTLAAPLAVAALGLTVVLIQEDFDISFAATMGLAGAAAVVLMVETGAPWALAALGGLGLGVLAGLVNGVLVSYTGLSSLVVTLAMSTVLIGVEYLFTDGTTVYGDIPEGFTALGQGEPVLGLNAQVLIAAGVVLGMYVYLEHTEAGRYQYAVGGNREAARLSGIRVRFLRLLGFVIAASAAGLAGLMLTAQSASSSPTAGLPYLLPAFAAVFLGTTMFRQGRFNVLGTVVGVLLLGVVQTGLIMLQLSTAVVNLVQGGILIAAVLVARLGERSR